MNMSAEHRQQMQNQGQNPAHAIFRQQAIKRFLYERAAIQQQRAGQGPHAVDRGNAVSQPGRPTSQVPVHQGQQVPPGPTSQNHDPSFDQFLGQQQDALRHQEAGQVVVPASLGAPPQVRGTPHPQPQGQFGVRPMQHPTSFQPQPPTIWTTPQGQHPNIPQTPQSQGPAQTPNLVNMPGQTPHQQALQGQLGGLDNSRVQRTPQQNPNMPTLNRPLNPPSQAQGTQRQAQPTPKAGSKTGSGGQQTALASGQPSVGQQPASSLSQQQKLQRYIASLAEPQKSAFIARFKQAQVQRKAEEAGQSAAQTGPTGAPVAPMGGPGTKAQPGPKATPIAPNSSKNATNGLKAQAQTPQQPRLSNEGQAPQQKFAPTPLDSDAIRMMDRVEFPRGLLVLTGKNTKVPENIKQWGQLKQWVAQNSDTLPPGSIQKVAGLQSIVYQQKVAQNKQQREASNQSQPQGNTRPAQPGVAPAAQMVAPSNSQTSIQGSTTQVSNSLMPVLPPPTIHEVTAARAQLPAELKSTSDEYLRQMISHKRRQEYAKTMQGQNGLTPQQQQQQQQQQQMNNILRMQQHTNVQQAQGSMQPNQHSQSQPPQRTQNQKPPPGQQWPQPQTAQKSAQPNPQQAKQSQSNRPGPQAVGLQQNQKGGKRNNNNDDVIEVPDPKLSQQPARQPNIKGPQPQPPPSNAASQMTSEMYNSLPPEQKAHFQEQRRLHIEANQRAQAQRHSLNLQGQRLAEAVSQNAAPNAGRDSRMKELRNDVMKNMPARQPIPMSPNTRAKMIDKLRSVSAMSSRLESSLPLFLSLSKDEEKTKELLRSVCKLVNFLEIAS